MSTIYIKDYYYHNFLPLKIKCWQTIINLIQRNIIPYDIIFRICLQIISTGTGKINLSPILVVHCMTFINYLLHSFLEHNPGKMLCYNLCKFEYSFAKRNLKSNYWIILNLTGLTSSISFGYVAKRLCAEFNVKNCFRLIATVFNYFKLLFFV